MDGEATAGAAGGTGHDVKTRGVEEGAAGAAVEDAGAEVGDAAPGPESSEGAPGTAGVSSTRGSPRAAY